VIARAFRSRPLPHPFADVILDRLEREHRKEPFSVLDPRQVVHRVARIIGELGVTAIVYRGGLDLRGAEVDHLWLAASHPDPDPHAPFVVDVAFPLFADRFVEVLRRFVAGDATAAELEAATAGTCVRHRVVGVFPEPVRYMGTPVWSHRA
jgi:hypothetical protein